MFIKSAPVLKPGETIARCHFPDAAVFEVEGAHGALEGNGDDTGHEHRKYDLPDGR